MGWFTSSEEIVEENLVDSNGHVNNNIVIQEAKDTHQQLLVNDKLLWATYILVLAEVVKFGIYLFCSYKKTMKKRYANDRA